MDRGSQVLVSAQDLGSAEQITSSSCQKQRKRKWRCPHPLCKDREAFWKGGFYLCSDNREL